MKVYLVVLLAFVSLTACASMRAQTMTVATTSGTPGDGQHVTFKGDALALEGVQKWIDGKSIRKVIVVPDKLVNVVVG